MLQQQQCILFKIHKALNTLCPAYNYSANLDRTKIKKKGVIKLHIKKKRLEKNTKTHRKKNPSHKLKYRGSVIKKNTSIATGGKYNVSG